MIKNERYFVLFANCIPVKGINRSAICDLHKSTIQLIPNDLYDLLIEHSTKTLKEIKENFNGEFDEIIDDYFEFLTKNNLGFFTDQPKNFEKLDLQWKDPLQVNNGILDWNSKSTYNIIEAIEQFNALGCKHIQMRFYNSIELDKIIEINTCLENLNASIISLDLILSFEERLTENELNKLVLKYPRITSLVIHSSQKTKQILPVRSTLNLFVFIESKIHSESCCGIINADYFSINIKTFTESQHYNSCLNRKISIDTNGNIKNCPSMQESFGNIKDTTLQEAVQRKGFKKYWNITKDQIDICKDCEFRYICTDCRAYIEHPEDQYSKPLKCGYDPYTNAWEDWSTNPLKQKAIEHYGFKKSTSKK